MRVIMPKVNNFPLAQPQREQLRALLAKLESQKQRDEKQISEVMAVLNNDLLSIRAERLVQ